LILHSILNASPETGGNGLTETTNKNTHTHTRERERERERERTPK